MINVNVTCNLYPGKSLAELGHIILLQFGFVQFDSIASSISCRAVLSNIAPLL
jgi:hypothetical protein